MLRQAEAGWASSSSKKPESGLSDGQLVVSLPLLQKAAGTVCLCGIRAELWTYAVLDTNNKEWFDKVVNDSNTGASGVKGGVQDILHLCDLRVQQRAWHTLEKEL